MRDPFDVPTIVFAVLAVFVLWKLWSVLGAQNGKRRPAQDAMPKLAVPVDKEAMASNVVPLPGVVVDQTVPSAERWAGIAQPGSALAGGLEAIAASDPGFVAPTFLNGAGKAYEMIVTAFAAGDRKALKGLLAPEVFDSFSGAISTREARREKVEMTFVSLDKAAIEDAQFKIPVAQITVRFLAKLISVTRSSEGVVVDGSPDKVSDMVDIWTFARDTNSRDPNWKLIATETGH